MGTWSPVKLTAMHHQHLRMGATIGDEHGWRRPSYYTSSQRELEAIREAGGVCDTSPCGKFLVQGSGVWPALRGLVLESASLPVNRATIGGPVGPDGAGPLRLVTCRLADDEAFIISSPEEAGQAMRALQGHLDGCAHTVEMTSHYAAASVLGPLSSQLLAKVTDLDISPRAFPDLSCAQGQLAEVYAIVLREDRGGLLGYDIFFSRDYGEYLWEVLLEAGRDYGIGPVGTEALKLLVGGD